MTINGLSGRDAVPPSQRKFGKSKLAARCLTDMVKRPMPCSVLQFSSWKQEVAKAKCRLAWFLEDRSKPKPNSPVLSPNTRRSAGGLFNKTRSDSGALSLWTMTMVRERSSVVLRHISHSESETLLRFNIKSNLSVVVLTQNRYAEITYIICQREWYEKRRDLKNMLKRWSRFRRS